MPQPKSQSSAKSTANRASAARKTAQQRTAAASRRAAAAKRGRAKSDAGARGAAQADELRANLQSAVEALTHGVVITRERLQEALDDAVGRGRMTPADASSLAQELLKLGRKQTDELRKQAEAIRADLEQLLGRAGGDLHKRASGARRKASRSTAADRALREVDRARRATGLAKFPILNYEDLTAAQITERLGDLSPAELRKVRDHERRNANRKSVLNAIEKALG
jgi:polyhydroxyalkanoate synthesis regulator phasin